MRYAFFGSPRFAEIILDKLIGAGMPPALVICNPDRPVGRKKIITPPPTKVLAEKNKIPVLQPEKLSYADIPHFASHIELFIVAAYSKILPKEIINASRLGTIGVHPSLLPEYRGATPIQSAILAGEEKTGVTLFLIDEKIDHGPILAKREMQIGKQDNYESLERKLAELGAELLIENLPKYIGGQIKPVKQDEDQATYAKKFTSENGYVDLQKDNPAVIERLVRALNPEPGVWTIMNDERTKLLEVEVTDGQLKLKVIQKSGKKPQRLN